MNILLDTLRTRLSFRWLGHLLGLSAAFLPLWNWFSNTAKEGPALGASAKATLLILGSVAAALLLLELLLAALDFRARRLKALAPTAFPFKKMEEADRNLVQGALGRGPVLSYGRAWAVWTGAVALCVAALGMGPAVGLMALFLGAPVSALVQSLGNAAMLQRVLPYFYFKEGYAQGLSRYLPSLKSRVRRLLLGTLSVALPVFCVAKLLGMDLSLIARLWVGLWALGLAFAGATVFSALAERPLQHLAEALGRLRQGDLNALLDVTSGDAVGEATEAFNQATRAVDRRLFLLEKFHQAVPPGRSEGVLDELRLDGELRPVSVLSVRWSGAEAALRGSEPKEMLGALSRFYEAVQDAVDRHQGSTYELADGALLAVWGAPFKAEGAVQQVLGAAWDLSVLLPVLSSQQHQRSGFGVDWSIGLASGQACAGLVGPKGRERYQVLGGPVGEARSLSLKPGGPWLDERSGSAAQAPFAAVVSEQGLRLVAGPQPAPPDPSVLGFMPGEKL